MGLLEVSLLGVSCATSRWTLTTTLFRAIKRINLSSGSKTCFYIYKRRLAIFTHFKTYNTSIVCYILFLFILVLFLIFFFSDNLTVVKMRYFPLLVFLMVFRGDFVFSLLRLARGKFYWLCSSVNRFLYYFFSRKERNISEI